VEEMS